MGLATVAPDQLGVDVGWSRHVNRPGSHRHSGVWVSTGQVTPVIDRTYPLDEAADALRYVAAGHTRGKVVVTV
jgi:NADPH:quinone reductase-like Zn-dependent oxidoreductase